MNLTRFFFFFLFFFFNFSLTGRGQRCTSHFLIPPIKYSFKKRKLISSKRKCKDFKTLFLTSVSKGRKVLFLKQCRASYPPYKHEVIIKGKKVDAIILVSHNRNLLMIL